MEDALNSQHAIIFCVGKEEIKHSEIGKGKWKLLNKVLVNLIKTRKQENKKKKPK